MKPIYESNEGESNTRPIDLQSTALPSELSLDKINFTVLPKYPRWDLNPQPPDYKSDALSIAPRGCRAPLPCSQFQ